MTDVNVDDHLVTDLHAYRAAVREFLASPAVDKWRGTYLDDDPEEMRFTAGLMRVLYDAGFGRYGMPSSAGGLGGDVRHWAVLFDELARAGITPTGQHSLLVTLAYPLAKFAPRLAAAYLPEFLSGDGWWGQGFSESEAGSDLAALRCRARRQGDDYVISGHKIWTSHAETANRIFLLARTGTPDSRHRGLSMILVDVDMPGVTVRPIKLASGRAELAECFFDDVHVPAALIGAEGEGWAVAMYLLQYERAAWAWLRAAVLLQRLRALIGLLSTALPPRPPQARPSTRRSARCTSTCSRSAPAAWIPSADWPPGRPSARRPAPTSCCSAHASRACTTRRGRCSDPGSCSAMPAASGARSGGTAARPRSTAGPPKSSAASSPTAC